MNQPKADGAGRCVSRPALNRLVFLATFLAAWLALDRLVTSPPNLLSATLALAVSGSLVVLGSRALGTPWRSIPASLGLGRPAVRALVAAAFVGGAYVASLLLTARALDVTLELRPNWPAVLLASLVFHGLAEELVWRGFAFGHFRRTAGFWRAVAKSVPLIALTHVPIVFTNGLAVGLLATATAATTCLPFAYLWERGGRTVWAPALLHGLIGSWQLFERTYPDRFTLAVLMSTIVIPMAVFLFRDRFFVGGRGGATRRPAPTHGPATALEPSER